jgi:hypothetical protein
MVRCLEYLAVVWVVGFGVPVLDLVWAEDQGGYRLGVRVLRVR